MVNGNFGGQVNHEPNTQGGPKEDPSYAWHKMAVERTTGRFAIPQPNTPYEQPRVLWNKVFSDTDRDHLIKNLKGALSGARREIQEGFLKHIYKIDPVYGRRLAEAAGVPTNNGKL